ncbi:bifunctional nuclease family protein [Sinomonas atrocyanea]
MIEVEVVGVRIELPSNQPLVLLKEAHGERHLPIWIGTAEASAIALAQQHVVPPRPLTHDLLVSVVHSLGRQIVSATIVAVEDSVFYAQLGFDDGTTVESRASDALAVALRVNCRIWCADAVLEEAGVQLAEGSDGTEEGGSAEEEETEMRRFREFLADVEPEDFDE